jgi:hypothetical protein
MWIIPQMRRSSFLSLKRLGKVLGLSKVQVLSNSRKKEKAGGKS